jgi:hypothetical protein
LHGWRIPTDLVADLTRTFTVSFDSVIAARMSSAKHQTSAPETPACAERWNWFISANYSGKWIVTSGYAAATDIGSKIEFVLRYAPDADDYAFVDVILTAEGGAKAMVRPGRPNSGTPSYELSGVLSSDDSHAEGKVKSIILTDGFTVLGLAHGSRSDEPNLA